MQVFHAQINYNKLLLIHFQSLLLKLKIFIKLTLKES
jgi:hypothetical protein